MQKKNVVVSVLWQEDASRPRIQHTIMDEVQEEMDFDPDKEAIRCENPSHYGMTSCAIQKGNLVLHCVNCSRNYKLHFRK